MPNAGYTQQAQVIDIHAADDILDEQNNPTAQKFASLMQDADDQRKRDVLQTMRGIMKNSSEQGSPAALSARLAKARAGFTKGHGHGKAKRTDAIKPKPAAQKTDVPKPKPTPVTPERQAVNMELAQSGSAFSVATLSQLANRQPMIEQTGPNEVTISLH